MNFGDTVIRAGHRLGQQYADGGSTKKYHVDRIMKRPDEDQLST